MLVLWPDLNTPEWPEPDRTTAANLWQGTRTDAVFDVLYRAIVDGSDDAAVELGLDHWPIRETNRRPIADELVVERRLAAMACDMAPDMGHVGPDRLLGDAAIEASVRDLGVALATSCFHTIEDDPHQRSPAQMWRRRKPLPPTPERESVHAIGRQPHRVVHIDTHGAGDLIDKDVYTPVVTNWPVGTVLLARMVAVGASSVVHHSHLTWPLDNVDSDGLKRWRGHQLWRERLLDPFVSLEDVMRRPRWVRHVLDQHRRP